MSGSPGAEGVSLVRVRSAKARDGESARRGRSRDPVLELETDELPEALTYRPGPGNPEGHGFVEPTRRMPFEEYERAVHETRGLWRPVGQCESYGARQTARRGGAGRGPRARGALSTGALEDQGLRCRAPRHRLPVRGALRGLRARPRGAGGARGAGGVRGLRPGRDGLPHRLQGPPHEALGGRLREAARRALLSHPPLRGAEDHRHHREAQQMPNERGTGGQSSPYRPLSAS